MNESLCIAICTYERREYLFNCLLSLLPQLKDYSKRKVSVSIIDSSLRKDYELVYLLQTINHANINYHWVRLKGIAESRNYATKVTSAKYIAFIDDDVVLEKKWLSGIFSYIRKNPDVAIFGGPAYSQIENNYKKPVWMPAYYNNLNLGLKEKEIDYKTEWIIAANMVFNKNLAIKIGGFNNSLGMTNNAVGYGEETEFIIRMKKMGHSTIYVPSVRVRHIIRRDKLSIVWHINSLFASGYSLAETLKTKNNINFILRYFGLAPVKSIINLFSINKYPFPTNLYGFLVEILPLIGSIFSYVNYVSKNSLRSQS